MDALHAELARVVDGLTYPSESDEPFDVIDWPAGDGEAIAQVKRQTGMAGTLQDVGEFFDALAETDNAERFATLYATLARSLKGLGVVRVAPDAEVQVYVIGGTVAGAWAGVHTVSIET